MLDLSQQEYVKRITELNKELTVAWEGSQRVKALKIVIQCAKLLADTAVIKFYPSKFVLITDILDTFGACSVSKGPHRWCGQQLTLPPPPLSSPHLQVHWCTNESNLRPVTLHQAPKWPSRYPITLRPNRYPRACLSGIILL